MKNDLQSPGVFQTVKNFTDLNEISEGMNSAVVSYFVTDNGKLCRMVSLFDSRELDFDHVPAGHSAILKSFPKWIKCFRHFIYRLSGKEMVKSDIEWKTVIM